SDTAASARLMAGGHRVGELARHYYDASGRGTLIDVAREGIDGALVRSAELLKTHSAPVFEAGFAADDALAFADVMLPSQLGPGRWRLIEVKATGSVKKHHYDDVAIQHHIATRAGITIDA